MAASCCREWSHGNVTTRLGSGGQEVSDETSASAASVHGDRFRTTQWHKCWKGGREYDQSHSGRIGDARDDDDDASQARYANRMQLDWTFGMDLRNFAFE